MQLDVSGRVAVVTGASRGIGLEIARAFCAAGGDVLLVSRRLENLEPAAASLEGLPGAVEVRVAHVGRPDEADATIAAALERFGRLDVLVNNAATSVHYGPLLTADASTLAKTFEVNVASVVSWSRAACEQALSSTGGAILNIASIGGLGPEPHIGAYNASKAAVIHMTRQLAWELAPEVRVNAIAPGLVRTELARGIWEGNEDVLSRHIPLRRIGEVGDISPLALLLVSDAGSWITGQTFVVDGGTTSQPSGGVG